ncbi:MAG TPA: hypothetical protein VIO64_22455 [Pseudobacteroides sp.]|uniref:PilN domain-containing protein n=1 Tax=Pseudobacteroides sp. TaxID=1968840 RepID=UPI002F952A5F
MKDINLLPDDIRTPQEPVKSEKSGVSTVKVVTLVIAVLALVGVSLVLPKVYIIMQNTRLDIINNNIDSNKFDEVKAVNSDIVKIKAEISKKNGIVIDIDNKNIMVGQIVNYISNSLTKGCTLDAIKFGDENLIIEGTTIDPMSATEFISYISRVDYLRVADSTIELKDGKYQFKYTFDIARKEGK